MLEKMFKLKENNTSFRTEVVAGLTTFMAMAYILAVNPNILSATGMNPDAILLATALASFVGCMAMALLANYPFALAPGMGLNAYMAFTVCGNMGYSWQIALLAVFVEGLIFIVLSLTNVREAIFNAIPMALKKGVSAGIGLFIAFLGLQDAKLVIPDSSTGVTLASFNLFGGAKWADVMPLIVAVISLLLIAVFSQKKIKGGILYGILGGTVLYYLLGFTVKDFYAGFSETLSLNPFKPFASFAKETFGKVFTEGFDFSAYLAGENHSVGGLIMLFITTALAFCMVDMFDTMGTLYGACRGGNLLVDNGNGELEVPNMNKAMLADAIATCTGAALGTSTVTTFVESSAGVAAGGKSGMTSLVTAGMFVLALFLAPLAKLIPAYAYGAALIYVGILMIGSVKDVDWSDVSVAVPAFLTMAMMPFTYNISFGIAFGLISYVVIKTFTGRVKEVKAGTWVITALFLAMFFLTH